MRIVARMVWWSVLLCLGGLVFGRQGLANAEPASNIQPAKNILLDPSFEETKPRDQFGLVFKHWGGWKYEGECEFRVGQIARSGKTSCLLYGGHQPKIRVRYRHKELPAGRYRITGYIRGLDIGEGMWRATTEFAFDDKYFQLKKNGTFGWTPLTYVVELKETANRCRRPFVRPDGAGLLVDRRRNHGARGRGCAADASADRGR
jgi:hypothetical protein